MKVHLFNWVENFGAKGEIAFNPFPHIDAFWRLCSRRLFEKHSDIRRNCTKRAISPFATMFSTYCHRLSIQLLRFSIFRQNTLKVVCCRIVVWGKGLKSNFPFCQCLQNVAAEKELCHYHMFKFSFCQNVFNSILMIIMLSLYILSYCILSYCPVHFALKKVVMIFWSWPLSRSDHDRR